MINKCIFFAVKMGTVEQPCYTIINVPTDSEPFNEMQLKIDLGLQI